MDSSRVSPEVLSLALHEISSRVPNGTLEALSHTPLWNDIAKATQDQNWWFQRTEYLVGRSLIHHIGDWSRVYKSLYENGLEFSEQQDYDSLLLVQVLLEIGADPSNGDAIALEAAARRDRTDILSLLLLDQRVTIEQKNNAILVAVDEGNAAATKMLLPILSVEHTISMLLSRAIRAGHSDVVKVLLDDGRSNPSEGNNRAIRDAVHSGDINTVRVLLSDKRVDPTVDHLSVLRESIRCGYADILELLLSKMRVFSALMSEDIYPDVLEAVAASRIEALDIIFNNEYVIPDAELFITAARMSSLDMMRLLLTLADEAPGVSREVILRAARIRKRDDMVELLTYATSRVLV